MVSKKIITSLFLLSTTLLASYDDEYTKVDYLSVGKSYLFEKKMQEAADIFSFECHDNYKGREGRAQGCLFAGYTYELQNNKHKALQYYQYACDQSSDESGNNKRTKECMITKKYDKTSQSGFDGMNDFIYIDLNKTKYLQYEELTLQDDLEDENHKEIVPNPDITSNCIMKHLAYNKKSDKELAQYFGEGYASLYNFIAQNMKDQFYYSNNSENLNEMISIGYLPETIDISLYDTKTKKTKIYRVAISELLNELLDSYYQINGKSPEKYTHRSMLIRSFLIANGEKEQTFDEESCRIFYDEKGYLEDLVALTKLYLAKNSKAITLVKMLLTEENSKEIDKFLMSDSNTKTIFTTMENQYDAIRFKFDPKVYQLMQPSTNSNYHINQVALEKYADYFSDFDYVTRCQENNIDDCSMVIDIALKEEDKPNIFFIATDLLDQMCLKDNQESCQRLSEIYNSDKYKFITQDQTTARKYTLLANKIEAKLKALQNANKIIEKAITDTQTEEPIIENTQNKAPYDELLKTNTRIINDISQLDFKDNHLGLKGSRILLKIGQILQDTDRIDFLSELLNDDDMVQFFVYNKRFQNQGNSAQEHELGEELLKDQVKFVAPPFKDASPAETALYMFAVKAFVGAEDNYDDYYASKLGQPNQNTLKLANEIYLQMVKIQDFLGKLDDFYPTK